MPEDQLENISVDDWGEENGKSQKKVSNQNSTKETPKKNVKSTKKKNFNLKLLDSAEKDAVMVAIMKSINLFKNPKYDKPRNPTYPLKQNWIKIALREGWMLKCPKCDLISDFNDYQVFSIQLKSKFGKPLNNEFVKSGVCPKCFKKTPSYQNGILEVK